VQVAVTGGHVEVQGPRKLALTVDVCSVKVADGTVVVSRTGDHRTARRSTG
jgi:hypothetical protein